MVGRLPEREGEQKMSIHLANRMKTVKASEIREMLKVTQRPDVISFAGGLPAPELFPTAELGAITQHILEEEGSRALQYSTTEGHPPLREKIAARMNAKWGTQISANDVLITTGSQQGLDLTGKLFLDEGDTIICESPTYVGAISAWNVFKPRWVEVPTDDDGMNIEALEECLSRCDKVKFIYVIPNFQNPSGRTWSLNRRRRFMEIVNRRGIPLIEDNPYGELRFEGETLPALKSFDEGGWVISLGTFSKIFCPGLRIAWVVAEPPLYEKFVILKQGADLHTSTLNQMQVERFMAVHDLEENIRRITEVYRDRRDAMVRALENEMPESVRFSQPNGGLFLWVELPERLNARVVLRRCLELDVAFVPGGAFFPNGDHENTLRLNFSYMPADRITEGIHRIAMVVKDMLRWQVIEERLDKQAAIA